MKAWEKDLVKKLLIFNLGKGFSQEIVRFKAWAVDGVRKLIIFKFGRRI